MNAIKIEIERKYTVCHGCLSADRRVSSLMGYAEVFFSLLGDQQLVTIGDTNDKVLCWECMANLKKIKTFQNQIRNAQITMLESFYRWHNVTPLSNLTMVKKYSFDQIFNYDYPEITTNAQEIHLSAEIEDEDVTEIIKEEKSTENILTEIIVTKEEYDDFDRDQNEQDDIDQIDNEIIKLLKPKKKKKKKQKQECEEIKKQSIRRYEKYAMVSKKDKIELKDLKQFYQKVYLGEVEMEAVLERRDRKEYGFDRMPLKCTTCRLGYKRKRDLNRHNAFHHNKATGPYKCTECDTTLTTSDAIDNHWRRHTPMLKCTTCGELCRSRGEIRKHVNRAHTSLYTCKECASPCSTLREFSNHYKNVHERLICDHCGKGYFKKSMLEGHIKRNHLPPTCEVCNRTYTQYHVLENHMRTYHPHLMRGALNMEASYCVECDKQFSSVYKFKRHIAQSARHTPQKRLRIPCPECGKVFTRTTYMNNHFRLVHMKDTKHYCELCNKFYATGYAVRKHRQYVHEKIIMPKNKICDICGRGFSTNRILANHRRTHTGERPFKCPHCAATFAQSTAMHTHIKTQHKNVLTLVLQTV